MALSHSPSIAMSGLVFNVDFGNIKSTSATSQFTRTNLLENPSFETNNNGWGGAQVGGTVRASSSGYATTYSRTNLITNPSFETDTATWSVVGAGTSITRITSDAYVGSACVQVDKGAVANGRLTQTATAALRVPVTAGQPYYISAYVKVPSGQPSCSLRIRTAEYQADGTRNSDQVSSTTVVSDTDGWVRLSLADTPTSGATPTVTMIMAVEETTANARTYLVDACLFEQSSSLRPYFDGNTAVAWSGRTVTTSSAWTGTANASTSTVTQAYTNSLNVAAYSGSNFGAVIMSSTTDSNVSNGSGSQQFAVGRHNVSAYFYVPTGSSIAGRTITLSLEGGTASTTSVVSSPATLVAGQWVRASREYNITTAGTSTLVARLSDSLATAQDEPIYLDGALIEQTIQLRPYFDGSTTQSWSGYTQVGSASWTGTAHASISQTNWTGLAYTYDLSTNSIVGEPSGPTFSSANNGSFGFVTDDLIVFPNNAALDLQTLTIEVWTKVNNIDQEGFLFEKGTLNSQYSLFCDSGGTGQLTLRYRNSANNALVDLDVNMSGLVDTVSWNQIVGTISLSGGTGTHQVFINNSSQRYKTSAAITGAIATDAGGMSIGAHGGYAGSRGYYFDGSIALVRVYNRVLTDDEVKQNFAATAGRFGL